MHALRSLRPSRRAPAAFTLIELLTVIAIIGILAAIMIPVTGKVRDKARATQCLSNVRQIALGDILYANDNKGRLLTSIYDFDTPGNYGGAGNWQKAIAGYLNLDQNTARSRFRCPSAEMTDDQENAGHFTSYDVSRFLGLNPGRALLNRIQQPIVIVADTFVANSSFTNPWNSNDSGMGDAANRRQVFRHNGGTRRNVGLTDGSARSLSPIQDGVFKDGAAFLPNLWLQPGASTYAGFSPTSPTDALP